MDEHKNPETADSQEDQEQLSAESRREFVTKLVTVAGAVAAGMLVGASGSEAVTDDKMFLKYDATADKHMKFNYGKIERGFRLTLKGSELGGALQQMGMAQSGIDLQNAKINIEFSW